MKARVLFILSCIVANLSALRIASAATPTPQLIITAAEPRFGVAPSANAGPNDSKINILVVSGHNFGTENVFGGTISITVPPYGDIVLKVRSFDPANQEIITDLPDSVATAAGTYLLKVSTGKATTQNDVFDLTIGAVGPKGIKGDTGADGAVGPQGTAGPQGAQGEKGDTGAVGPQGPQGETGPKGDKGDVGPQGLKGDAGAVGADGPIGPKGEAGPVGPKGETGATGPKGDTGPQGLVGEQGPKGDQGVKGDTGPQGPQGEVGAVGPQGPKGETGATGTAGPQGPKGDTGATGATGEVGPVGPQGPKGDIGLTGAQGPKGDVGAVGATGPQGPQGLKGDTGAVGPVGPQGAKGDVGLTGPQGLKGDVGPIGPAGPQGAQGLKGDTGAMGAVGPQGLKGDTGLTGATGPVGPQGPKGDIGLTGAQGPKGDVGAVGATGLQGPQGPKGDTGAVGPVGPQGAKGDIGLTGPQGLKGDVGSVGPTGPQGVQGLKGDTGAAGAVGPQGPKGDTGLTGATGAVGPIGLQGPKGDTGAIGATGAQGPKGDTGAAGATGPSGPQGIKGDTGLTGAQGPQGVKGDAGATGPIGPQGPQGVKGDTGAAGPTGPVGSQGPAGLTGAPGAQGPQGPIGNTGPQGPKGDTGSAGPIGATGPMGPSGPQGPAGPQGLQGPAGSSPFLLNGANAYYTAGNLGIGTSTPTEKLEVAGVGRFGFSGGRVNVGGYGLTPGDSGLWMSFDSAAKFATLQSESAGVAYRDLALNPFGGKVGVGTSTPKVTLDVNGDIQGTNLLEKSVTFTPTAVGWYRIVAASETSGGVVRIYNRGYDNTVTDIELQYNISGYGIGGAIQQTRFSNYNGGVIGNARISSNGGNTVYLDIYVRTAGGPQPIKLYGFGPNFSGFVPSPVVGAAAGPANVSTLELGHGLRTTSDWSTQSLTVAPNNPPWGGGSLNTTVGDDGGWNWINQQAGRDVSMWYWKTGGPAVTSMELKAARSPEHATHLGLNDNNGNRKVHFSTGGVSYFMGGSVGIATDSPAYTLDVNGTIRGTVVSPSDARWKKDIQPLSHALDTVSKLEGVSYRWRQDEFPEKHFPDNRQVGVIAQQVEKVAPELVTTDQDGYKAVNYTLTVPLLIEAIKELKAQNETLRARVEALEKRTR